MTFAGLVTAVVVGVGVGLAGGLAIPGHWRTPVWLTVAMALVAAMLGAIFTGLAGLGAGGPSVLAVAVQTALAGLGVGLVAVTARARQSDSS